MSALKNQFQHARVVIQSLAQGVHPTSRALGTAVLAIDQVSARVARRAQLPESVGKAWTEEEERRLRAEFGRGERIPDIAAKHGRTVRAIEGRLEKLGLLTPAPGTASPPFMTTPGPKEKR